MAKKIVLLVSVLFLVGCTANNPNPIGGDFVPPQAQIVTETKDGVNMAATYLEKNQWEYTLITNLPNPCYSLRTESTVAESYPEQVTVKAIKVAPEPGVMCAQVIERREIKGSFAAGPAAKVSLVVAEE